MQTTATWSAIFLLLFSFQPSVSSSTTDELLDEVKEYLGDAFKDFMEHTGVSVTVDAAAKRVEATVAEDYNLPVLDLFTIAIPPFADTISSIQFFEDTESDPLNFNVDSFLVDLSTKTFSLATRKFLTQAIHVIPGFLSLSEVTAAITVTINTDDGLALKDRLTISTFQVSGAWAVGDFSFNFNVTKNGDECHLSGQPDGGNVDVTGFVPLLNAAVLPGDLKQALEDGGLGQFSL